MMKRLLLTLVLMLRVFWSNTMTGRLIEPYEAHTAGDGLALSYTQAGYDTNTPGVVVRTHEGTLGWVPLRWITSSKWEDVR